MTGLFRDVCSGLGVYAGALAGMRCRFSGWFVLVMVLLAGFGGVSSAFGQANCTDTVTTGVPQTECEALVALYTSTNGAGWSNSTNWNTAGTSVDTWYGVGVSAGGQVTSLNLSSNQLTGSIPTELGNLTNLTSLYLYSRPPTSKFVVF